MSEEKLKDEIREIVKEVTRPQFDQLNEKVDRGFEQNTALLKKIVAHLKI